MVYWCCDFCLADADFVKDKLVSEGVTYHLYENVIRFSILAKNDLVHKFILQCLNFGLRPRFEPYHGTLPGRGDNGISLAELHKVSVSALSPLATT